MEVAWQYGEIYRQLQSSGKLIGTNDMWIAATALVHKMGVVTRNISEFQHVAGLIVVPF
jgi:tRNA(fMet)-specific endonuclease VapC